ncbi:hypothetical protein [Frankia sp. EAN1pec]|uniref:hypothetical protein n=1 Tax=Parafrankia sp. (strain EAN1pec) TaxID=298653 RepID=UPI00030C3792
MVMVSHRSGFRRYGKSMDHRDNLPQGVIGLAVLRDNLRVKEVRVDGADGTGVPRSGEPGYVRRP